MFKSIIRCIKSSKKSQRSIEEKEPEKVHLDVEPILTKKKVKNIAIIVGHSENSKGAVSYTGESEWDFNHDIAQRVRTLVNNNISHDKAVFVFYRNGKLSYKDAMKDIAKRVASMEVDLSIELHFNSYITRAYGCEILVAEDAKNYQENIRIADKWTDELAATFGLKERGTVKFKDMTYGDGVKVCKVGERGYWNLAYLSDYKVPYSILIEPMFANTENSESVKFFTPSGKLRYAEFLARMINDI